MSWCFAGGGRTLSGSRVADRQVKGVADVPVRDLAGRSFDGRRLGRRRSWPPRSVSAWSPAAVRPPAATRRGRRRRRPRAAATRTSSRSSPACRAPAAPRRRPTRSSTASSWPSTRPAARSATSRSSTRTGTTPRRSAATGPRGRDRQRQQGGQGPRRDGLHRHVQLRRRQDLDADPQQGRAC